MYGVFSPDADALRRVLDRPEKMLGHPYCGYLIYLARAVDGPAVQFLERFSAAVDVETGEALAFLVLLDNVMLHGRNDPSGRLHQTHRYHASPLQDRGLPRLRTFDDSWLHARLPTIDVPETTSGAHGLTGAVAKRFGSIPTDAFYRADPEWSLKFAAHIGLHRGFLPCIVAMDDPGASDDDRCAVIPLADAEVAWNALTDAISTYVDEPDTQAFISSAERVRSAEREVITCERAVYNTVSRLNALQRLEPAEDLRAAVQGDVGGLGRAGQIIARLPSVTNDVLNWAAGLQESERQTVVSAALRAGATYPGAATLDKLLKEPEHASAAREIRQTLRRLRNTWLLSPTTDNPHLTKMIAVELAAAQGCVNHSPDDLPRLIAMTESADREAFLALVETRAAHFPDTELANCLSHLDRFVRPQIPGVVRDEQIAITQAEVKAAEERRDEVVAALDAAKSALKATPMSPFVPHVARAVGTMPGAGDIVKRSRLGRTAIAAGGTAFLADIVQILQGLGVIR